jgi:hypothetical protein
MSGVTHLEFLVEEPSAEAALRNLVPRILPAGIRFEVRVFNGKPDLLGKLPMRLRAYKAAMRENERIVILVDEDRQDCRALKKRIDDMVLQAGLLPKARARAGRYQVLSRIAVEELEAWLMGDAQALAETYSGVSANFGAKRGFRDVDAISGGTAEALERLLQQAGHFRGGLPKRQVAREVSARMEPSRNTSRSFQAFCQGLRELMGGSSRQDS